MLHCIQPRIHNHNGFLITSPIHKIQCIDPMSHPCLKMRNFKYDENIFLYLVLYIIIGITLAESVSLSIAFLISCGRYKRLGPACFKMNERIRTDFQNLRDIGNQISYMCTLYKSRIPIYLILPVPSSGIQIPLSFLFVLPEIFSLQIIFF